MKRGFLDRLIEALTILAALGMIASIVIQILGRVILPKAPVWTEEASRYFFIYLVSFGAALAVKYGDFVSVDTFIIRLNEKQRLIAQFINNVVVILLMIVDAIYAIDFIKLGMIQKSSAMLVPMHWIYSSMIILPILVLIYLIKEEQKICIKIRELKK